MSFRNAAPQALFPDRTCLGCGRRGGGAPESGLDNVAVYYGHEACGHCLDAFLDSLDHGALFVQWAKGWRRSLEVTRP